MGGSLIGVHWSLALSAALLVVITAALFAFDLRSQRPAPAE
jgi:hypothetical protein